MSENKKEGNTKLLTGIGIGLILTIGGIAIWRLFLKNAHVSGTVTDQSTGQPLAGAIVNLFGGDGAAMTVATDQKGSFAFTENIKTSYILQGYPYFYYYVLTVNMDGYAPYTASNLVFHPAVNTINIQLEAL